MQTLEQAITKATERGWRLRDNIMYSTLKNQRWEVHAVPTVVSVNDILFDPAFARALWGEEEILKTVAGQDGHEFNPAWQYHLQMMVVSPSPLDYLLGDKSIKNL